VASTPPVVNLNELEKLNVQKLEVVLFVPILVLQQFLCHP